MRLLKSLITRFAAVILAMTGITAASCDRLHEDLLPCPSGARLRFIYDYNMEFANAFPAQVDCLTLLVYDSEGKYLQTVTADRTLTSDEDWRLTIDLPSGDYKFIAYGGIGCDESSFGFTTDPTTTPLQDLQVNLSSGLLTSPEGQPLHHLYFGDLEMRIPPTGADTDYVDGIVYMKKDTNDVRILLANVQGLPTDAENFEFTIITDNTLLDSSNEIVPTSETTYYHWSKGNLETGILPNGLEASMAFAEISTSRFVYGNPATLLIKRKADGKEVIKVPLINILLALKSDRFTNMKEQEFLDRESRWNLTFLLNDNDTWLNTTIIINDWVVRVNDIDFSQPL